MTTQSPHLYSRQHRPTGPAARATPRVAPAANGVHTRLPWWALALPAIAFAALLALLTGGTADASAAAPAGDWLGRLATALPDLIHHLL